jgi:hypothetical protein
MLLVCLHSASLTQEAVVRSGRFAVAVLARTRVISLSVSPVPGLPLRSSPGWGAGRSWWCAVVGGRARCRGMSGQRGGLGWHTSGVSGPCRAGRGGSRVAAEVLPRKAGLRRARRWSNSSFAAGQQGARAGTRGSGAGSPHGQTGRPSVRGACRSRHANEVVLRCDPRPPHDHLKSTQRMRITRLPCYVRDRHAARSRTTAGVLGRIWCSSAFVRMGGCAGQLAPT